MKSATLLPPFCQKIKNVIYDPMEGREEDPILREPSRPLSSHRRPPHLLPLPFLSLSLPLSLSLSSSSSSLFPLPCRFGPRKKWYGGIPSYTASQPARDQMISLVDQMHASKSLEELKEWSV